MAAPGRDVQPRPGTGTRAAGAAGGARGFTLVELMIVLAVVAIFASLAGPSFRELTATQKVRSAVSALNESLWLARSEAIKRNADVAFEFDDVADGWTIQSGGATLHTQDPFSSVASGAARFVFNGYGRLTERDGVPLTVQVSDAGVAQCVTVTSTGRTTAEDGAC